MKKLLLILLFTGLAFQSFAAGLYAQNNWVWRKDDGTESLANPLAGENAAITISNLDVVRLRMEVFRIDIPGGTPATDAVPILTYYTLTDANPVELTSDPQTTNAFYLTTSAHDVSGATTKLLTNEYPFVSLGKVYEAQATDLLVLDSNNSTELEWVLKPTAHIVPGETYSFKIPSYDENRTPQLIASTTLPVDLLNYSAKISPNGVKLQWSVASETNNSHFTVAHSLNGSKFTNLGTKKSAGSGKASYTFDHYTPQKGTNYYRLSQTDFDGTTKILGIDAVNFSFDQSSYVVTPNPANGNNIIVSLSATNKEQYRVKLFDFSGRKLIDKDVVPQGLKLVVNPNQPIAAGTYIVEVEELGRHKVIVK